MIVIQKEISLAPHKRGFHLITKEIERELGDISIIKSGLANIFIKHTSAGLTLNENADETVRADFQYYFDRMAPEDDYEHSSEGEDDMPAHLKSSIIGASLIIPITNGKFNLGLWQGIYLCEFRNNGGHRKIEVTIMGV